MSEQHERECGDQWVSGGPDPYGANCSLDKGHEGKHRAENPYGPELADIEWDGSGAAVSRWA